MEYYRRAKSQQEYYQSRLFSLNWCVSIWIEVRNKKIHPFYKSGSWDLKEELLLNKVNVLCLKQLWEF